MNMLTLHFPGKEKQNQSVGMILCSISYSKWQINRKNSLNKTSNMEA